MLLLPAWALATNAVMDTFRRTKILRRSRWVLIQLTTVADAVGHPSASGVLADTGWYYVESTFTAYGIKERREMDREVVAITFDDEGVVRNIERFGLENGRVIAISRRVTDSNIKGVGLLRQLFGNVGNFTAEEVLN